MNDISRTVAAPWIASTPNVKGRIRALLPFLGRWMPKVTCMFVAMLVGSLVALVANSVFGAVTTRVRTIRALPALSQAHFSLDMLRESVNVAVAVTGLALKSEQRIDGNQEFISQHRPRPKEDPAS